LALSFSKNPYGNREIGKRQARRRPGKASSRPAPAATYLISREGGEMLKLIDSGCVEHQARHIAFTGVTAVLVTRLILNLPLTNGAHHYICEQGHTHYLTVQQRREHVTSSPRDRSRAGDMASPQ
jgi:hypothetical protein